VSPSHSPNDLTDLRLVQSVLGTQNFLRDIPRFILPSDLANVFIVRLGHAVSNAARKIISRNSGHVLRPVRGSSLLIPIGVVVYRTAFEQMMRIAASPVIAPVTHKKSNRVFAGVQQVRNAMRLHCASCNLKYAVSVSQGRREPIPALISARAIYLCVKAMDILRTEWGKLTIRFSHDGYLRCG
jgi:hypothetical protein